MPGAPTIPTIPTKPTETKNTTAVLLNFGCQGQLDRPGCYSYVNPHTNNDVDWNRIGTWYTIID